LHYLLILKSEEHRHGSPPKKKGLSTANGSNKGSHWIAAVLDCAVMEAAVLGYPRSRGERWFDQEATYRAGEN
jgi:hypothetical protein